MQLLVLRCAVPPSRVVLRALFERRELELGVVNGERRLELSSWLATAVQFECDAVGASTAPTFTWNVLSELLVLLLLLLSSARLPMLSRAVHSLL